MRYHRPVCLPNFEVNNAEQEAERMSKFFFFRFRHRHGLPEGRKVERAVDHHVLHEGGPPRRVAIHHHRRECARGLLQELCRDQPLVKARFNTHHFWCVAGCPLFLRRRKHKAFGHPGTDQTALEADHSIGQEQDCIGFGKMELVLSGFCSIFIPCA